MSAVMPVKPLRVLWTAGMVVETPVRRGFDLGLNRFYCFEAAKKGSSGSWVFRRDAETGVDDRNRADGVFVGLVLVDNQVEYRP